MNTIHNVSFECFLTMTQVLSLELNAVYTTCKIAIMKYFYFWKFRTITAVFVLCVLKKPYFLFQLGEIP